MLLCPKCNQGAFEWNIVLSALQCESEIVSWEKKKRWMGIVGTWMLVELSGFYPISGICKLPIFFFLELFGQNASRMQLILIQELAEINEEVDW